MSKAVKPEAPQKVDYNDAVAESKKYFDGDDLAATVWVSKYALKDSFGNIYETSPRQMHERIAAEIERIERKYPNPMSREEVFGLLDHFRYVIPQGGPMTGIGNNFQVASLSNCFVIPFQIQSLKASRIACCFCAASVVSLAFSTRRSLPSASSTVS